MKIIISFKLKFTFLNMTNENIWIRSLKLIESFFFYLIYYSGGPHVTVPSVWNCLHHLIHTWSACILFSLCSFSPGSLAIAFQIIYLVNCLSMFKFQQSFVSSLEALPDLCLSSYTSQLHTPPSAFLSPYNFCDSTILVMLVSLFESSVRQRHWFGVLFIYLLSLTIISTTLTNQQVLMWWKRF